MIAALSVQVYFNETFILHAAFLVKDDTVEDILEQSRVIAVDTAKEWSRHYEERAKAITLNIHFENGLRFAKDLISSYEELEGD